MKVVLPHLPPRAVYQVPFHLVVWYAPLAPLLLHHSPPSGAQDQHCQDPPEIKVHLDQLPLQKTFGFHVFFVLKWSQIICVGNEECVLKKSDTEQSDSQLDYTVPHSRRLQNWFSCSNKKPYQLYLQKYDRETKWYSVKSVNETTKHIEASENRNSL